MILTIEEHNEAYLAITYLYNKGIIRNGLSLVHIDEHHDLGRAIVDKTMLNEINNLSSQKDITYKQLRISDFILPLIYHGIFKNVHWINNSLMSKKSLNYTLTKEFNENFIMLNLKKTNTNLNEKVDFKLSLHKLDGESERNIIDFTGGNQIVSIDLDYFSCDDEAGEYSKIEISEESYISNTTDIYSKWKMRFGSKIDFQKKEGRFYMIHREIDGPSEVKISNKSQIDNKVRKIENLLGNIMDTPKLIIICKSYKSGYTPPETYEYIYQAIVRMLDRLYGNKMKHISDIKFLID